MASERSTDAQAFIGELDGGVFETKIGAVLSEVASGVMNTKTKGKVSSTSKSKPFDENRVKINTNSYVRPTNRGKIEEDTTETPMYVTAGGRLTILQEDSGQLLTLAGEPGFENSAQQVINTFLINWIIYLITEYLYIVRGLIMSQNLDATAINQNPCPYFCSGCNLKLSVRLVPMLWHFKFSRISAFAIWKNFNLNASRFRGALSIAKASTLPVILKILQKAPAVYRCR